MLTLIWFRRDLRLADNPALVAAARDGAVCPIYIHNPGGQRPGRRRRAVVAPPRPGGAGCLPGASRPGADHPQGPGAGDAPWTDPRDRGGVCALEPPI
ncbi:MAG: deoxyribodipyrimidine photo-lyase [Arhodomonas sp.]|nr:deoxyribodipyrimidine photo-lyase [Arhodomonas sp.]